MTLRQDYFKADHVEGRSRPKAVEILGDSLRKWMDPAAHEAGVGPFLYPLGGQFGAFR